MMHAGTRVQILKTFLFCIIHYSFWQLMLTIQASDHFSFLNSLDKWLRLTTGRRMLQHWGRAWASCKYWTHTHTHTQLHTHSHSSRAVAAISTTGLQKNHLRSSRCQLGGLHCVVARRNRAGRRKEGMVRPSCEKMRAGVRTQILKTLFCIIHYSFQQLTLTIQASDHFSFLNSFDKWLRLTTGRCWLTGCNWTVS